MSGKKTKGAEIPDYLDYNKLKELGISYLQAVEGSIWTDFNIQDPGVTVLELLCWSLMDLGYRTSFAINDLLTHKGTGGPSMEGTFHQAHEILSCNPVTCDDYRKLVLENIPQIRNVWFEPTVRTVCVRGVKGIRDHDIPVKGFYRVSLDLYDGVTDEEGIIKEVTDLFHSHRNLCENMVMSRIETAHHVKVGICAEIETDRERDLYRIFNTINSRVSEYVCPSIRYHTLDDMIRSGKTPDQIYQGSNPRYGFIDADELRACRKRTALYTSDVLNLIMSIEGVKSVSHLHFTVSPDSLRYVSCSGDWKLSLKEQSEDDHAVSFVFQQWPGFVDGKSSGPKAESFRFTDPDTGGEKGLSGFVVRINGLPFYLGEEIPLWREPEVKKTSAREPVRDFSSAMPLPDGTYRFTDRYFSLQNLLPEIYRMGRGGISEKASPLKKGQRLQFKAYLLLFEQIMADYLAQLSSMDSIFSWKDSGEEYDLTYFSGILSEDEIKDLSAVLSEYSKYHKSVYPESVTTERRDRFLNHLLARFNEEFIDYSVFRFWHATGRQTADFDVSQAIRDKKAFLSGYVSFSRERFRSTDLTAEWSPSPVELRIMSKLGTDSVPESLAPQMYCQDREWQIFGDNSEESYNTAFGIHIIEHPLLALCDVLDDTCTLKLTTGTDGKDSVSDPYSMQVTVAVPGWLDICRISFFRKTVEKVIREELPAHISAKICWVDPPTMFRIEKTYRSYLSTVTSCPDRTALSELVTVLNDIHSIYPSTVLGNSSIETGTRIGYSVLGSDMNMRRGKDWAFEGEQPVPATEVAPEPEFELPPETETESGPLIPPEPENEPAPEPAPEPELILNEEPKEEVASVVYSVSEELKSQLASVVCSLIEIKKKTPTI